MTSLQEGNYLHIYNHANGRENLFREDKNYYFFLGRYDKYISPIAATLAYCLMPNHYHFLIRIEAAPQVCDNSGSSANPDPSHGFKNLFQSYTKAYNKKYDRMGSLFNQRFKRKVISSDDGIRAVMRYIHLNPVLHGFCSTPDEWTFSSFNAYKSVRANTKVKIEEGLSFFDNRKQFLLIHREMPDFSAEDRSVN
jgi:REP element-mobilizing transposase RayT